LVIPDPSDQEEQLREAKAVVEQGVDAVVVCGGDGIVGLGVNLVAQQEIPLGIVPTGSGNDFARAADIPRRHANALQRVLQALAQPELPVRRVDAIRLKISCAPSSQADTGASAQSLEAVKAVEVRERSENAVRVLWVANSVNIGFDAQVNQRANAQRRVPRQLRYLVALAQEVPRFCAVEFGLRLDSGPAVRQKSSLICIQNGGSIGGGIPLAPRARIDDGWAEVSHIEPLSRAGMVTLFPVLMLRMHRLLKPLTTRQIRHIRVEVPPQVPVFADGEELHSGRSSLAAGTVVEATLIPGAVLILD
jgi:diacylglycerol kinase (ATP)